MTIIEQVSELGDLAVGASVVGAVAVGVWPLKLLWMGVDKLMEALR